MSIKSKGRTKGREIRRATGLPFGVSMRAGKLLVRGRGFDIIHRTASEGKTDPFAGIVHTVQFDCGAECCGIHYHKLVGPKGEYRINY